MFISLASGWASADAGSRHSWNLGLITIFLLAGIYPLMKRVTYWPQAWLGMWDPFVRQTLEL
jgi:4-hydroxybenzoate polyprenyltransferase